MDGDVVVVWFSGPGVSIHNANAPLHAYNKGFVKKGGTTTSRGHVFTYHSIRCQGSWHSGVVVNAAVNARSVCTNTNGGPDGTWDTEVACACCVSAEIV